LAEKSHDELKPLKADELIDDVFGLNIRGLRTVVTAIIHPRAYADAAFQHHWGDRYTPSIRLWFSLMAVWAVLQVFWLGNDSPFVGVYADGLQEAGVIPVEGQTYLDMGRGVANWFFGLLPVAQVFAVIAFASLFGFWGRKTNLALRQRLVFAVTIPGVTVTVFSMLPMSRLAPEQMSVAGIVLAGILAVVDFTTGYRGAFAHLAGFGRIWRAGLLALCLMGVNLGVNIAITFAAFILAFSTGTVVAG
jgi:hypothetical protein